MSHGITVRLPAPFAPTVQRVRTALKEQGFGVLTEIDVQATLREKLDVQMEDYLILVVLRHDPVTEPVGPSLRSAWMYRLSCSWTLI